MTALFLKESSSNRVFIYDSTQHRVNQEFCVFKPTIARVLRFFCFRPMLWREKQHCFRYIPEMVCGVLHCVVHIRGHETGRKLFFVEHGSVFVIVFMHVSPSIIVRASYFLFYASVKLRRDVRLGLLCTHPSS